MRSEQVLEDEIIQFISDWRGYYAYSVGGLQLGIVHSVSLQPDIEDPDDYYTWLWVESLQGFFLMRQHIVNAVGESWWVVREYVPEDSYKFFFLFLDVLKPALRSNGETMLHFATTGA